MFKRIALFSPQLLQNASEDREFRDSVEIQIKKVYGDEDSTKDLDDELEQNSALNYHSKENEFVNEYETNFPGNYKCILCPKKILISEMDLNKHLKSKYHMRMVLKWEEEQKNAGIIRKKFNEAHNLCSELTHLDTSLGTDLKTDSIFESKDITRRKRKGKKKKIANLSEEKIMLKKLKFLEKKRRRMMRKSMIQ